MTEEHRYFTTQQVAKLLGVSVPTVVNWIKQGRLEAHRTPGGHRRIAPASLKEFARRFSYPLPFDEDEDQDSVASRILVVDSERDFGEVLAEYLQVKGGLQVKVVDNPFDAGLQISSFRPHLVILDVDLATIDGPAVVRTIRSMEQDPRICILASTGFRDSAPVDRLIESGVDRVVEKPFEFNMLLVLVQGYLR